MWVLRDYNLYMKPQLEKEASKKLWIGLSIFLVIAVAILALSLLFGNWQIGVAYAPAWLYYELRAKDKYRLAGCIAIWIVCAAILLSIFPQPYTPQTNDDYRGRCQSDGCY